MHRIGSTAPVTHLSGASPPVLFTVYVEVEVFLRQFVVRTVFTQLCKGFVEGGFQLGIILTQANPGAVAKVLLSFTDGPANA